MLKTKKLFALIILLITAGLILGNSCQGDSSGNSATEGGSNEKAINLKITDQSFAIDGDITSSEYSAKFEYKGFVFFLGQDKDTIRFAIQSEAKGWVSCGFNSSVMNDALIYMAYVKDDRQFVSEQLGMGHKHEDTGANKLIKFAVKETPDGTAFEGQIKTSDLITPDQLELAVIVASSNDDSFTGRHRFRTAFVVPLKK